MMINNKLNSVGNKDISFLQKETKFHWYYRLVMDKVIFLVTAFCLILILIPLFSIFIQVYTKGIQSFSINILTHAGAGPLSSTSGISHAIKGTILTTLLASIIGIPLGLIIGIFLEYFGKGWWSNILRVGIDTMVSIPTIITGVVVWYLLVKSMGTFSILAGGIALAFIMIPIIAKTTEEMIRLVPSTYDEVGYSLGLTEARTAMSIVVPLAGKGIVSGILLAYARIVGETAPLLFTAFFSQSTAQTILQPSATLTVLIYNYAISPFKYWENVAWVAAMLLITFNLLIVFITRKFLGVNNLTNR